MTTNSTTSANLKIDLPDLASGKIRCILQGLAVNSELEVFHRGAIYEISLNSSGEATSALPTPDATGDASYVYLAQKQASGATTWENVGLGKGDSLFVFGYSASPQELGTLLQAADTAVDPDLVGILAATSTWLTAEKTAIEAATDGNLLQGNGTNSEDSGIAAASVSGHIASTSNPHSVTAVQVDALPIDGGIVAVNGARDLATTDAGKILECTGTFALNCPNGLDTGFQVALVNVSSGTITITATTTLQSKDSAVTIDTQYAAATLYHRGSNVWLLAGDIA